LAVSITYALAAYVILPRIVRMSRKILQRKSVPSFTLTGDGNIACRDIEQNEINGDSCQQHVAGRRHSPP
jgi:hypothetical protein